MISLISNKISDLINNVAHASHNEISMRLRNIFMMQRIKLNFGSNSSGNKRQTIREALKHAFR